MTADFQMLHNPLDENHLRRTLSDLEPKLAHHVVSIELIEQVTSSNDRLLYETEMADSTIGHSTQAQFYVCLAESQTAGKGRRGDRVWHSPKTGNLYLSVMRYTPAAKTSSHSAWLALSAGTEVVSALAEMGFAGLGIKWPNDIYYQRGDVLGKLGGLLVETKGACCVIGLGLNVHFDAGDKPLSEPTWIALDEIRSAHFDRTDLAASMIAALLRTFMRTERDSPEALMARWRRYDVLADKVVTVQDEHTALSGIARGVDACGRLRVEHSDVKPGGSTRTYYSSDVSIRW